MAIKLGVSLLLVSLAISFFLPTGSPAAAAGSAPLITKTCSGTAFPDVCTSILQSDPRSATADLVGLARISLEQTLKVATDASKVAYDLLLNSSGYEQWSLRSTCYHGYDDSIKDIKSNGFRNFDLKKYNQVFGQVDTLKSSGDYCASFRIPEMTEKNTAVINFTTDVKTILHLLF